MPEQYEPDSGKTKTYQSIAVYDGSNPAYFKNWHAKVLSHYATWLNGEERAGHWKQHLVSDGCFIYMPSSDLDDRYLKLFRPHLAADKLNRTSGHGSRSSRTSRTQFHPRKSTNATTSTRSTAPVDSKHSSCIVPMCSNLSRICGTASPTSITMILRVVLLILRLISKQIKRRSTLPEDEQRVL